jgi:hypothetical protein
MSTASGLMVSVTGTISFDLWRGRQADVTARRRRFRIAALTGVLAPVVLALVARELDISVLVGWAFALAASTFCPLLLLGIWWERLTARGAAAGLITGAGLATGLIFVGVAHDGGHPTVQALLTQPAVLSVPSRSRSWSWSRCAIAGAAGGPTPSCSPCARPRGSGCGTRSHSCAHKLRGMTPLVEREREVAALAALLDALAAGEGRVAWIEGPAGIGKSTLLAEERRHAADAGAQVLAACGSELSASSHSVSCASCSKRRSPIPSGGSACWPARRPRRRRCSARRR